MTYDEWKLETPEDEAIRHARFWKTYRVSGGGSCLSCQDKGVDWDEPADDGCCYECGRALDYDGQHDPDDARDDMQDREWNK